MNTKNSDDDNSTNDNNEDSTQILSSCSTIQNPSSNVNGDNVGWSSQYQVLYMTIKTTMARITMGMNSGNKNRKTFTNKERVLTHEGVLPMKVRSGRVRLHWHTDY
jgi:Tol biopolymer transport system component